MEDEEMTLEGVLADDFDALVEINGLHSTDDGRITLDVVKRF